MMALRFTLNGCWQPTHKRPLFLYINWGLGNRTVGAGRPTQTVLGEQTFSLKIGTYRLSIGP